MLDMFDSTRFHAAWQCYIEAAIATPPLVECEVLYDFFYSRHGDLGLALTDDFHLILE